MSLKTKEGPQKPFVPLSVSAYFLPLMNRLRTHIARFVIVLLICSGFGLSLVQPAQAEHSTTAFADWLSAMTKSSNGTDLQQELENLRKSGDHLDKVIEQASQIVSNNNEEFPFSYAESMASQQLYQMLLIEWNQFQTGNAMSCIPVQQTVKSLVPVKTDKTPLTGLAISFVETAEQSFWDVQQVVCLQSGFSFTLIPMVGGIAMRAP